MLDPRDGRTLLAAAKTGHLGPDGLPLHRSRAQLEGSRAAARVRQGAGRRERPRGRPHVLADAGPRAASRDVWYAGTSPQGLFRSEDGGVTWEPFSIVNDDPQYREWMGSEQDGTPDGPKLHSIIVDPRDPAHLLLRHVGRRRARVARRRAQLDAADQGLEVVEGFDSDQPSTFHDPHCVRLCPSNPDRLYQQNHCGIYRLDRPGDTWVRIGRSMPKQVGDIGFPMVVHPRDADTAGCSRWTAPTVWPRTSPDGKPAVYVTRNGGKTWQRLDAGLPRKQAWWTVKRQAMTADAQDPVGLYFGTTSGELWMSRDEGTHVVLHRAAPAGDLRGGGRPQPGVEP